MRIEFLEPRYVLNGTVVIDTVTSPGALILTGNGGDNNIDIAQTSNVGEFIIHGNSGTLLKLNTGPGTFTTSPPINGILSDITVDLKSGNDIFTFNGNPANPGGKSSVPANLIIMNDDGWNQNTIQNVQVNKAFTVTKVGGTSGRSDLTILNSTVIKNTIVDNTGGGSGGETNTTINNSKLQGAVGGTAFTLLNGDQKDITSVQGNSQFGTGGVPNTNTTPVVSINNGAGGSQTIFTGASASPPGAGTTTVYGRVDVTNAFNDLSTVDFVSFNGSNVLGPVNVSNGDGDSQTQITNSTLGSNLTLDSSTNLPTIGGPVVVLNQAGYDSFSMNTSTAPWGIKIDNNNSTENTFPYGSSTIIDQSSIGTGPYGPRVPLTPGPVGGDALILFGDDGVDVVTMTLSTLGGRFDMDLFDGDNNVTIQGSSKMAGLRLITSDGSNSDGNDTVVIDSSSIYVDVYLSLGNGTDLLTVSNLTPATQWPTLLTGSSYVDFGFGFDAFVNTAGVVFGTLLNLP